MLTLLIICGTVFAKNESSGVRTPYYGWEGTVTSPLLRKVLLYKMRETWREIYDAEPPESKLHLYAQRFPDQYVAFELFVNHVFGEIVRPRRIAHKRTFPAYHREFSDGFWMQYQFEYQAIEAQAQRLQLPKFLKRTDQIDREFYLPARRMGFAPEREFGMGHLRESLDVGYDQPEHVRNRLVFELNDAYVWPLLGPDVEAAIHWDVAARGAMEFHRWLRSYDSWLHRVRESSDPGVHRKVVLEMLVNTVKSPLFARRDDLRGRLHGVLMMYIELHKSRDEATAARDRRNLLPLIMFIAIKFAFESITEADIITMVAYRRSPSIIGPDALEFRRIPAQENADEVAMWMRLLEGRWWRAIRLQGLARLQRPIPPQSDEAALKLFVNYVESARMNPLDFAKFLPAHLAERVPRNSIHPRWSQIKAQIQCESDLMAYPPLRDAAE